MIRSVVLTLVATLCAVPAGAQATGGGVTVAGWTGRVDPKDEKKGAKLGDVRFAPAGEGIHVVSGPPAIYWNPAHRGRGSYTVAATFTQNKAPQHAEYYGLFMGGSGLEGPRQNYLYCVITGDGTFTVKHRIGDEVHELAGRTAHQAIVRADGTGRAANELAWRVTPERTACLVNGTEVWGYASKDLLGPGKLESVDGVAGLRVNHGLDVRIGGFAVTPR